MIAEILSTGEEVLTGAVVDSNAAHIAAELVEAGVVVNRHLCVGDDMEKLVDAVREIATRCDVAVVTGGLGPTDDDLTAQVFAHAAGVRLIFSQEADDSITAFFTARKRPRTKTDGKQAMLPDGSSWLLNPVGTAPGFQVQIDRCTFFCLPGVPHEMRRMMTDAVMPEIERMQGKTSVRRKIRNLSLFGLGEASVNESLQGFTQNCPDVRLGMQARFPTIQVKLYADGEAAEEVVSRLNRAENFIMERVGRHVFSSTGERMEAAVGRLLRDGGKTLATAESCTGGLISHLITNVAGSSAYFVYGGIVYSNQAKIQYLQVAPDTIDHYGAVSEETVREMAAGVRRLCSTDYGLATSGIAGPGGGTDEKPVGTVCIGIAGPDDVSSRSLQLSFGHRQRNKEIFATAALELLRRKLLGIP